MQYDIPFGYKITDGKIEVCEEHGNTVEQIFQDYDKGISVLRISKALKEKDFMHESCIRNWSGTTVGRILENPSYLGTEYYPRIIDRELFDRVQKRREQVRIRGNRGGYRPNDRERELFTGMLFCAECGKAYVRRIPHTSKSGDLEGRWRCKSDARNRQIPECGGSLTDKQVEAICICAVNRLIDHSELIDSPEPKIPKISLEYRRLDEKIQKAGDLSMDEIMALMFERAAERYKTLEIRDEDIRTEAMQAILNGKSKITEFDEDLYRGLISRMIVYENHTIKVVFQNSSSTNIGY